tara:strand:- start:43801 stop:44034 length:234 start_codon:yes stop_codon:yes gene_type:complete
MSRARANIKKRMTGLNNALVHMNSAVVTTVRVGFENPLIQSGGSIQSEDNIKLMKETMNKIFKSELEYLEQKLLVTE